METAKQPKKSHYLIWWKLDHEAVKKEADNYKTLSFFNSSRGLSVLLLAFSCAVTAVFIFSGYLTYDSFMDVGLMIFLAIFIYFGHRWAIIIAMAYWTLSKGFALYEIFNQGTVTAFPIFINIAWWAVYMGAFYKAYHVEKLRKQLIPTI